MKNDDEKKKSIAKKIKETIEHNPRHYIELNIFGKKINPCARCFGLWLGLLITIILTVPFWMRIIKIDNFYLVFIFSWLLVIPALIDWTTSTMGIRKTNNLLRILTGFLYGSGIIIYLFVLPTSILFRIITYLIFEIIFHIFKYNIRINYDKSYFNIKR